MLDARIAGPPSAHGLGPGRGAGCCEARSQEVHRGRSLCHAGGKAEIRSPAPTLGQHTEKVLAELLGLKAAELAELRAQHVTEPVTERKG